MYDTSLDHRTSALLEQLLREKIGSQVELEATTVLNQREDYVVLRTELCHPKLDMVVKLAGPRAPYPCPFDRTALFHKLVASQTAIPIAEVLAVDTSYSHWPWRYIIKTHLPGESWAIVQSRLTPRERREAYQQMGRAIAQLHTIAFPHFGDVELDMATPVPSDYLTALIDRAHQRITRPHLVELFLQVVDVRRDLFSCVCQPVLCHEDLHKYNILFWQERGNWQLATILDFDKAWAGHQESDLARLDLWTGMVDEGFWSAYRESHPIAEEYLQRRPVYQFFWCLEYADPSPVHLADTRSVCEQLGIAPLLHFD